MGNNLTYHEREKIRFFIFLSGIIIFFSGVVMLFITSIIYAPKYMVPEEGDNVRAAFAGMMVFGIIGLVTSLMGCCISCAIRAD